MRKIQRKRATLELQSGLMEWRETFEQLQSIIAKFGGGDSKKKTGNSIKGNETNERQKQKCHMWQGKNTGTKGGT